MIKITFPDGNFRDYNEGVTVLEVAKSISSSLAKVTVAAKVDNEIVDLRYEINNDSNIMLITTKDKESLDVLRHTAAHVLAAAIKVMRPGAKFAIGPAIEEGFYYDVDIEPNFSEEELVELEKVMKKIASSGLPLDKVVIDKSKAKEIFKDDEYKLELLDAAQGDISLYEIPGKFIDLCRGPHLLNVSQVKHFKLLNLAGAYFRGDSSRKQLQRIYGTAFFNEADLNDHLKMLEERKERDHRKIGKELKMFELNNEAGQGLAMWLPNGYKVRKVIEDYLYNIEVKYGYKHISTPILGPVSLYKTSGHWDNYSENMFPVMERDGEEYVLRPMSCPHHMLVYKTDLRSYKDLPIKYSETVIQHRYEASGGLTGLERVRGMTLTDSHMFVRPDQINATVKEAYTLIEEVINKLGLKIEYVELALRGPAGKYHNDQKLWDQSEQMLRDILDEMGIQYKEMADEAAFYGPKIDVQVKTNSGRIITLSTVQLDFLLPERFDLTYIDHNGEKCKPVVIHRGLVGTYERLMSIMLEQYKGAFPTWMAPVQALIIPVNGEAHGVFAKTVLNSLQREGLRVEIDERNERLGLKIREAQKAKIPFQIVIGDNEVENNCISVRRFGSSEEETLTVDELMSAIKQN